MPAPRDQEHSNGYPVPERIVVGIEVGGVTWSDRRVTGVTRRTLVVRDPDGWSVRGRIHHAEGSLSRYAPVLHRTN